MGYINLTARRRVPYMDSYVFGAAFYYGVMVLFTLYMFLFATPSIARVMPYKVVSYLIIREKLLLIVSFKHEFVSHEHKLSPTKACFPQNTRLFLTNTPHKGIT